MAKHAGGRPPMFKTPDELEKKVDQYFNKKNNIPTWTGLALHLGFNSRQALNYYMDEKPGFLDPLKKALTKVEVKYEQMLYSRNPAGAIFALKNFGWSDKHEIDHTSKGDKIEAPPSVQVFNTAPPLAESEDKIDAK